MRCLVFIWFLFSSFITFGYINKPERQQLLKTLEHHGNDSATVLNLISLSGNYSDSSAKALYYDSLALRLSQDIGYHYGIVLATYQRGLINEVNLKDYASAIRYYKMTQDTLNYYHINSNDRHVDEIAYGSALNLYFYLGDFVSAMKMATTRLAFFEKVGNRRMESYYCNLIGFIYLRQNDSRNARKYYMRHHAWQLSDTDRLEAANAYTRMADVDAFDKDYSAALLNMSAALDIYQRLHRRERMAYTMYKIGNIYKLSGNYNQALQYTLQAVEGTNQIPCNEYDVAAYYENAAAIYSITGQYNDAIKYARQALNIATNIRHTEDMRDASQVLSTAFAAQKRFDSAYYYDLLYNKLKDSIISDKTNREIAQIQAIYEVDKKDGQIALLNEQNNLRESDIMRQKLSRNIVIVICVFVVIVSALLYNRRILKQQNRFQLELNKRKNELFDAVVTLQDKERKRIAQDIHDSLGSMLSATKLSLARMEEEDLALTDEQKGKYETTLVMLEDAISEMRNISHNIMPAILSRYGLVAALENSFERIAEHSGLTINFSTHAFTQRLTEAAEISIYRVIMELINNVVKHAGATVVTVQLIAHPDTLNITVEDNGKGFNYEKAKNKEGIGLTNISSRVSYLKGTIDIDSAEGQGTTVIIEAPLKDIIAHEQSETIDS